MRGTGVSNKIMICKEATKIRRYILKTFYVSIKNAKQFYFLKS